MKTSLTAAVLVFFGALASASATTITFSELPIQAADGVSLLGVTFDFKVGGIDSTDAIFGAGGPGTTTFTSDPGLEGNTLGKLSLAFGPSVGSLQFGVALLANTVLANGFSVSLYDPSAALIGTSVVGVAPGGFSFSSGQFNYAGGPVSRADITFNSGAAPRFSLDNVTFFQSVPDAGSTFVLLGLVLFGLAGTKRSLAFRR